MLRRPPRSTLFPSPTLFRWGDTLDIAPAMMRVTLAIAAKTLFDADVEGEAAAIGRAITTFLRLSPRMTMPLASLLRHLPLRSEEHTSELQSQSNLVCRLLLE